MQLDSSFKCKLRASYQPKYACTLFMLPTYYNSYTTSVHLKPVLHT